MFRVLTGIIVAAAVALAFVQYFVAFIPLSSVPVVIGVLVVMSAINFCGIETSTRVNLVLTDIEIAVLLFILVIGIRTWGSGEISQFEDVILSVFSTTFLLFFAYRGFESLVNLAEEVPENEYRQVVREMFEDGGLPTEVVDDRTFEYADSIW